MVYKDMLNKMIDEFVDHKEDLVRELRTCPPGELHVSPRNGKCYYYQYIPKSGNRKKTIRKGISKDHEKVMQLVRKRYLRNALKNLDEDIRAAESMLSQYSPDFTIRRPRDHKIFYWEHFGMVDDPEYLRRSRYKLSRYEEYGIVPWDNLIITYNGYDGSINGKLIDAMIQGWLL